VLFSNPEGDLKLKYVFSRLVFRSESSKKEEGAAAASDNLGEAPVNGFQVGLPRNIEKFYVDLREILRKSDV
jgi:hypothetical protein